MKKMVGGTSIRQTTSAEVSGAMAIRQLSTDELAQCGHAGFAPQLSWTHYSQLMRVESVRARSFYETRFEQALVDHMRQFLLELGCGFAFVARQQGSRLHGAPTGPAVAPHRARQH